MESNAASKSAANRIPVKCLECVSYNMSDISRIGSPMYLPPTKADCSLEISKRHEFFNTFCQNLTDHFSIHINQTNWPLSIHESDILTRF